MLLVTMGVIVITKALSVPTPSIRWLIAMTGALAILGAVSSLAMLIGWMIWYERTTGYDSGNAPVAWIFFFGPICVTVGQLLALVWWCFRKPIARSETKV